MSGRKRKVRNKEKAPCLKNTQRQKEEDFGRTSLTFEAVCATSTPLANQITAVITELTMGISLGKSLS